jgi:hypothetical protein
VNEKTLFDDGRSSIRLASLVGNLQLTAIRLSTGRLLFLNRGQQSGLSSANGVSESEDRKDVNKIVDPATTVLVAEHEFGNRLCPFQQIVG